MTTAILTITIGTTPAGCEWIVYRRGDESDESMMARADEQRASLARLWDRRTVRLAGLTERQVEIIGGELEFMECDKSSVVEGKTTFRAQAHVVDLLLGRVEGLDVDMLVSDRSDDENHRTMAERAAYVSKYALCAKLAHALGHETAARSFTKKQLKAQRADAFSISWGV